MEHDQKQIKSPTNSWYIYTIDSFQFLLGINGFDNDTKLAYNHLVLWSFHNEQKQINILKARDSKYLLCVFGKSVKLVNILKNKGVSQKEFQIQKTIDSEQYLCENNLILEISDDTKEGFTIWDYKLYKKETSTVLSKDYLLKASSVFNVNELIEHEVNFDFEIEAQENEEIPVEVKKYLHQKGKTGSNLKGCLWGVILGLILLLIIALISSC